MNLKENVIGKKILVIASDVYYRKGKYPETVDGYMLFLEDNHTILMGIDDKQECCERWGVIECPVDKDDFIGAVIIDVLCVNAGSGFEIKDIENTDIDNVAFINIDTDKGLFQFAVYNSHDGYYGHNVIIDIDGQDFDEITL